MALPDANERLRQAIEFAPIGMAVGGLDGRLMMVNRAYCKLLGYPEAELLRLRYEDFSHPDDLAHGKALRQQLLDGELSNYEVDQRFVTRDRHVVWVQLSVSLTRDASGNPVQLVAQVQDITARKEVERTKDEFTSMVGHELRTPMTAIRGSLGLLQSGLLGELSDEAQDMVAIAVQSTDRLVRLINDFLEIERMRSGKVIVVKQRCDAGELIREALEGANDLAVASGVTLHGDAPTLPLVADPDRVIQVLGHLLSNAIKFSPEGASVEVTASPHADGACFEVRDHGRGIPQAQIEAIFERFRQVERTDSSVKGGTGMGLALSKAIIEQHGGRIWAESTPGRGATLRFTLPPA